MTALSAALGAGFTAALGFETVLPEADGRLTGFAERADRRASGARFFDDLRLEEARAFTARRNFAMPGG